MATFDFVSGNISNNTTSAASISQIVSGITATVTQSLGDVQYFGVDDGIITMDSALGVADAVMTVSFDAPVDISSLSIFVGQDQNNSSNIVITPDSNADAQSFIDTGTNVGENTFLTSLDVSSFAGWDSVNSFTITYSFSGEWLPGIDDIEFTPAPTNTAPVFSNLDGGETHVEASGVTRLDHNVLIADVELDALNAGNGDYNGASITIARNGGANADDEFGGFGQLGALIQGNTFQYNSSTVGTVTTNSGGTLVLTFNSTVTSALADQILRSIAYSNSNSSPPASVTLDWTFNDGTTNSTGTNQTTVNITDVTAATSFAAAFDTTDGTNLTPGITFGTGDETLTIADAAHIAGSTIDGGGGTDTLELPDTANISGVSVSGFESLTLASGASVTMTEAQHDAFSTISGAGTEQITISAATDGLTGDADIETYVLGAANSFTLGAAAQNVTGSSGNDTISVGGLTASGTLNGAGGTDTLIIGNGGSIADALVSGIETLTVSSGASVTMTEAQHDAFSTINGTGTNQITISAATDGLSGSAAIETYVLGAANSFTLGAAAQNVTGSSGNDTVNIGSLTATGTLNAAGGTDTLEMSSGANISGASVSSFENLTLASGASVTVGAFQLAQFSGTITAAGSETVTVIGDGDFTTLANVESFLIGDDATNTRTVTVASANTDVTASELTDAVTFNLGTLTYTGTLTGEGSINDTVSLGNGASIASATLNNIENLTLASGGSFTMNASQLAAFTGTITAAGSESVTVVGDGNFTMLANVEAFNINDDSTNTRTVTVVSANTDVTATSGSDAVIFNLGSLTYTGTITGEDTTRDTLALANGANISGGTINNVSNLMLGVFNSVTMTVDQLNALSGAIIAGGAAETINLTATGTLTGSNLAAIEILSTVSGGSETITLAGSIASGKTLVAADAGTDAFVITGSAGAQMLNGSAGDDTIDGGAGDDTIAAGAGTDSLTGGAGDDRFVGSVSDLNGDTISDLVGGDSILLQGVTGLTTSNVRVNGTTLEIDTDATNFLAPEVAITLGGSLAGLVIDSVSDAASDTLITFVSNSAPAFANLDGTPSFTEGGSAVVIDSDVTISDTELDALNGGNGDYAGASLTVQRNGGADATDSFGFDTSGALFTVIGSNLQVGGQTFALYTNSSGTLTINFTSSVTAATSALVDEVLQRITYANTANDPDASVTLDYTFNDGTSDSSGTNQATVSITNVNDAPTLSATGQDPTYIEGSGGADLYSGVTASAVEAADRFTGMTVTVTNVSDGADEILAFDGSDIALTNGNSVTTDNNGLGVTVSVTGSTATVSFGDGLLTNAQMQTLVDAMNYRNESDNPTMAGNRVVTITGITDNGGTANGGVNAAAPNLTTTVSLTGVNDAPVIGNVNGDTSDVIAGSGAVAISGFGDATVTNADSADYNGGFLTLTQNTGTTNGNWSVDGTTVSSTGDDGILSAGETIQVDGTTIGTVDGVDDGQGGNDLTINFNSANATSARVESLIQNLQYSAPSVLGDRTFTMTLNDADGTANGGVQDDTANFTISITPNPPVVGNLDGDSISGGNNVAIAFDVDGDATVSDADSAQFNGGSLTIDKTSLLSGNFSFAAGVTSGGDATIGIGETIAVSGTDIGTVATDGQGANDLVVDLDTDDATPANVQALIRALQFTSTEAGDHTFDLTITDSDASPATSAASTVTLNVQANPVNTVPGGSSLFDGTAFALTGISVADSDSASVTTTVSVGAGVGTFTTTGAATITGGSTNSIQIAGTIADVNATLGNLMYTPAVDSFGSQTITVATSDGTNSDSDTISLTVYDRPTISNLDGDSASTTPGTAIAIDTGTAVAITDGDNADLNQGTLTISRTSLLEGNFALGGTEVTAGGDAVIAASETISVSGTDIGTVSATEDGQGSNDLVIDLLGDGDATFANVAAFINALTYASDTNGAHRFDLTIEDQDNAVSEAAGFTVNVATPSSGGSNPPFLVVNEPPTTDPSTGAEIQTTRLTNVGSTSGSAAIVQNTNNNGNLVTATLPGQVSLTSTGPTTAQSGQDALTTLVNAIDTRDTGGEPGLITGAQNFLNTLATTTLDVRTIVPTTTQSSLSDPIVITGTASSGGSTQAEAFVIDLRSLPSGSTVHLDNIEFASIMGNATVTGGAGDNYVTGDDAAQFITLGVGEDTLFGGAGNDTVSSTGGYDVLYGNQGDDLVTGGDAGDWGFGGQGEDVVYGEAGGDVAFGNRDADVLYGNTENDVLFGNEGDDSLYGGQDEDTLFGGQGDDVLYGNTGNDDLVGNTGNDTLYGGDGADSFSFHAMISGPSGSDVIADYDATEGDVIAGDIFTADSTATLTETGLQLTAEDGSTLLIIGVTTLDDMVFA